MKAHSRVLLGGAAALLLGGCCTWFGLHCGSVDIHEYNIALHPGTNISHEDQVALDKILEHRKSELWRLSRVEGGHVQTRGRLADMWIDQNLLAEAVSAISQGVAHSTVQIGITAHPDHPQPNQSLHPDRSNHPNRTNNPDTAEHALHPNSHPDYAAAKRLVEEVTPILKKYSRD